MEQFLTPEKTKPNRKWYYNRFTIESIRKAFGIKIPGDTSLFENIAPVEPSAVLAQFLDRYLPLGSAIGTEKARSEFIIAPILAEITELTHHAVSLFSGHVRSGDDR